MANSPDIKSVASCCVTCRKHISNKYKGIQCNVCNRWVHYYCVGLSDLVCNLLCAKCINNALPFATIDSEAEYTNALLKYCNGLRFNSSHFEHVEQLHLMSRSLKIDQELDADRNCPVIHKISNYVTEEDLNSFEDKGKIGQFSILHINARSLIKNIESILLLIHRLHHKFSVIAVTETWTDMNNEHLVNIDGYSKIIKHRENGRGGGVALYIDSDLKCMPVYDLAEASSSEFESVFADVYIASNSKITVGAVYRPPGNDIKQFNENFELLLSKIKGRQRKIFLAGDFNINLLNHETHVETGNFLSIMFNNKYYPLIARPTRYSESGATLIDNIFTNCIDDVFESNILLNDISDHLPVYCSLNRCNTAKNKCSKFIYAQRIIDDEKIYNLIDKLNNTQWNITDVDVNNSYNNFSNTFISLYNDSFPVTTRCVKTYRSNTKPWFTTALNRSVKRKAALYNKWIHSRESSDLTRYKKYKNKLTSLMRLAEKNYYNNKFIEIEGDLKKTWKLIKSILPKSSLTNSRMELNIDGKATADRQNISDKFNQYFTQIGPDLAKKIPGITGSHREFINTNKCQNSMFINPVTTEEIISIVNSLKGNKAAGHDNILPKI